MDLSDYRRSINYTTNSFCKNSIKCPSDCPDGQSHGAVDYHLLDFQLAHQPCLDCWILIQLHFGNYYDDGSLNIFAFNSLVLISYSPNYFIYVFASLFFNGLVVLLQQKSECFYSLPMGWNRTSAALLRLLGEFEREGSVMHTFF